MALEKGAGLGKVVGFDDQDGAIIGDEPGAVVQVDIVGREQFSDGLKRAGFVVYFDAEYVQQRDHEALLSQALNRPFTFIHQKFHHAKAATACNRDPPDIDSGAGDDTGDSGSLPRFVFYKNSD